MNGSQLMARIKAVALTLGVAALYFICSRIGLMLAFAGTNATPLWPPAGIALALLLLYGRRMVPGIFLGAFAANFYQLYVIGQGVSLGGALFEGLGIGLGNSCEALLAAFLVRYGTGKVDFTSLRGMLWFLFGVAAGSLLATAIATVTLMEQQANLGVTVQFAMTWWLGDSAAMMIIAPLLVSWLRRESLQWKSQQALHLFVFASLFMLALNLWFEPAPPSAFPVPPLFLLVPLLAWAALVFSTREVSLILFLMSSFTLYRTLHGGGVFVGGRLEDILLELQVFNVVAGACVLTLNGAFIERRDAKAGLRQLQERNAAETDEQVQTLQRQNRRLQELMLHYSHSEKRLQESEDRLELITQATSEGIWEWQPAGRQFRYSSRFKSLLGYDQFDQLPQSLRFWLRRIDAGERGELLQACRRHLQQRTPLDVSFRMRNKSGETRWYRLRGQAIWNERNQPVFLAGSIADVQDERLAHDVVMLEKRLLERMTSGAQLQELLNLVVELLCVRFTDAGCSLVLPDSAGVNPRLMACCNLDEELRRFSSLVKVGPQAVGAAAAIHFNSQIVVDDITRHPDWRPYLAQLRECGLKACWALPVRNRHGSVLGAIALYFSSRRYPSIDELEVLDRVARLAGITVEQHETRVGLQKSEQRYRELYHNNPAMFFSLDRDGLILSVNQFGAEHLGYGPADLVGRDYGELIEESTRHALREAVRQTLLVPGQVQVFETRKQCADGRGIWVRDSLRAMGTVSDQAEVLVVAEDITDIRELSDRLAYHASHDPLTGLINRRKFETELVNAIQEATTRQRTHALCYLDLDLFKVINDTYGHTAGDELLRQLGRLLEDTINERGQIARLGGDEFGLLILNTEQDQVMELAQTLSERITQHQFMWERRPYHVGVSIGIVMIDNNSDSLTNVLSAADSACYVAREAGRNRIHVYHEDDKALQQRHGELQWVSRIPHGIRDNSFTLAVQEIVALHPGVGERHFELLIRYRDENGDWIQPGAFLPAAERYSLATMLDRWVFVQLAQLLQQPDLQQKGWVFNVNLSAQSVINDDFQQFLIDRIRAQQLPAERICFEITETAAVANLARVQVFIEALKELGCSFALDDFGSGLSSIGYLKGLSVDYIKIDGQFTQHIESDEMDLAIVKSINEVGHVLGKRTVAECVENAATLRRLQAIGVDQAQGYHLAVPLLLTDWLDQMQIPIPQAVRSEQP